MATSCRRTAVQEPADCGESRPKFDIRIGEQLRSSRRVRRRGFKRQTRPVPLVRRQTMRGENARAPTPIAFLPRTEMQPGAALAQHSRFSRPRAAAAHRHCSDAAGSVDIPSAEVNHTILGFADSRASPDRESAQPIIGFLPEFKDHARRLPPVTTAALSPAQPAACVRGFLLAGGLVPVDLARRGTARQWHGLFQGWPENARIT